MWRRPRARLRPGRRPRPGLGFAQGGGLGHGPGSRSAPTSGYTLAAPDKLPARRVSENWRRNVPGIDGVQMGRWPTGFRS
ncbi:hypothetical protein scyTo_0014765 [Scyliorhinus torazame]|uniref:Uncharacterized protein n=1 Tax=Scyliorhinus torazame TaxID=75743 RepID=A0A401NU80_SCYTO|nr:hypothetical protein [Scyliorhinus torazame]